MRALRHHIAIVAILPAIMLNAAPSFSAEEQSLSKVEKKIVEDYRECIKQQSYIPLIDDLSEHQVAAEALFYCRGHVTDLLNEMSSSGASRDKMDVFLIIVMGQAYMQAVDYSSSHEAKKYREWKRKRDEKMARRSPPSTEPPGWMAKRIPITPLD